MSTHVLGAAAASAASRGIRDESLWKAYSQRAGDLASKLALHDARLLLKGFADVAVRDPPLFRRLVAAEPWARDRNATSRDLVGLAASLSKLGVHEPGAFGKIADAVGDRLGELSSVDLASLAQALARAGCCSHDSLSRAVGELAGREPEEISPAAAAMALNALGMCSALEPEAWSAIVDKAVLPRLQEFTVSQAALVVDAVTRSPARAGRPGEGGDSLGLGRRVLDAFAAHWLSCGQLSQAASPEDLAYIAGAYARLPTSKAPSSLADELGREVAGAALRLLSHFNGRQLAMTCAALVRYPPSGAREALFAQAAGNALPPVLPWCTLRHTGQLLSAFAFTGTEVPAASRAALTERLCKLSREATVGLAREATAAAAAGGGAGARAAAASSGTVGGVLDGAVAVLAVPQARAVLGALAPFVTQSARNGSLTASAAQSVIAACARLQVRDTDMLGAVCDSTATTASGSAQGAGGQSSLRPGRLLVSMGMLGMRHKALQAAVGADLAAQAARMPLAEVAHTLLAVAVLGTEHVPEAATMALAQRASRLLQEGCQETHPREAVRLLASAHALGPILCQDLASLAMDAAAGTLPRLDPPPHEGVLRGVAACFARVLPSWQFLSEAPRGGFVADLRFVRSEVGALGAGSSGEKDDAVQGISELIVEVDGPSRFYHGTRELVEICRLKQAALLQRTPTRRLLRVAYQDWPGDPAAQDKLLLECIGASASHP